MFKVPNNGIMLLEQALGNVDTRLKCCECGHIFKAGEGLYNFTTGKLCVRCYDKKYK